MLQDAYSGETMARYVFRRLSSEGRQAELLNLPDTFSPNLHSWLLQQVLSRLLDLSIGVICPHSNLIDFSGLQMSDEEHVGSPESAMCQRRIRAQPCWS